MKYFNSYIKGNIISIFKFSFILISVFLISIIGNSQSGNWQWAQSFASTGYEYAGGITTDKFGKIYSAGNFTSTSFTVGSNTFQNIGTNGNEDFYITKLDTNGAILWVIHFGDSSLEYVKDIKYGHDGYIYVYGAYVGKTFQVTDNIKLVNSAFPYGGSELFLLKITTNGSILWAKSYGASQSSETPNNISINKQGHINLTGKYLGATFIADTFIVNAPFGNIYNENIFSFKVDTNGNVLRANVFHEKDSMKTYSICVDESDNTLIAGSFSSQSLNLFPFTLNRITTGYPSSDMFVIKINAHDSILIAKNYASPNVTTYAFKVISDTLNNFYIGGSFGNSSSSSVDIDTITLYDNFTCGQSYIAKFDSNALVIWANAYGGDQMEYISDICLDNSGNLAFSSTYFNLLTVGSSVYPNNGSWDGFIVKMNAGNGSLISSQCIGGAGEDRINKINLDVFGNIVCVGIYKDSSCNIGNNQLQNLGNYDIYVCKLSNYTPTIIGVISSENSKVQFYPNPVSNQLNIELIENSSDDILDIKFYDINGNLLLTKKIHDSKSKIDVSHLSFGQYICNIVKGNEILFSQLILKY